MHVSLLIPTFAFICSTPLNEPKANDNCTFKDGDRFPTFLFHKNGKSVEVSCAANDICLCDGTNAGYKGCQSCCCTIRERIHGNKNLN